MVAYNYFWLLVQGDPVPFSGLPGPPHTHSTQIGKIHTHLIYIIKTNGLSIYKSMEFLFAFCLLGGMGFVGVRASFFYCVGFGHQTKVVGLHPYLYLLSHVEVRRGCFCACVCMCMCARFFSPIFWRPGRLAVCQAGLGFTAILLFQLFQMLGLQVGTHKYLILTPFE